LSLSIDRGCHQHQTPHTYIWTPAVRHTLSTIHTYKTTCIDQPPRSHDLQPRLVCLHTTPDHTSRGRATGVAVMHARRIPNRAPRSTATLCSLPPLSLHHLPYATLDRNWRVLAPATSSFRAYHECAPLALARRTHPRHARFTTDADTHIHLCTQATLHAGCRPTSPSHARFRTRASATPAHLPLGPHTRPSGRGSGPKACFTEAHPITARTPVHCCASRTNTSINHPATTSHAHTRINRTTAHTVDLSVDWKAKHRASHRAQ